jgi:hypothetical protein
MSDAEPRIPSEPNASDEPHDVLAAEKFAMPAPEEARHDGPVALPPEPNPSDEPHDVLAAEEFAMPAPPRRPPIATTARARGRRALPALAGAGLVGLLLRRRGRGRR